MRPPTIEQLAELHTLLKAIPHGLRATSPSLATLFWIAAHTDHRTVLTECEYCTQLRHAHLSHKATVFFYSRPATDQQATEMIEALVHSDCIEAAYIRVMMIWLSRLRLPDGSEVDLYSDGRQWLDWARQVRPRITASRIMEGVLGCPSCPMRKIPHFHLPVNQPHPHKHLH